MISNARTSHMQNCGNHLPQVNCSVSLSALAPYLRLGHLSDHGATLIDQTSNIELSHEEFSGE